jgi:Leucine-rich repeat (LRR) protein
VRWERLPHLEIGNNQLAALPAEIGNLKNLRRLSIEKNRLTGVPATFARLAHLDTLALGENPLTDITPEIFALKSLRQLFLHRAQLTRLPAEIAALSDLEMLDLSSNQIGELPPEVCQLNRLAILSVSFNKLETFPDCIGTAGQLRWSTERGVSRLKIESNPLSALPGGSSRVAATPCWTISGCSSNAIRHRSEDSAPFLRREWRHQAAASQKQPRRFSARARLDALAEPDTAEHHDHAEDLHGA